MENNEELVFTDTENVEETTEQTNGEVVEETKEPEKLYTEEDFNKKLDEVLAKKIARKEAKIRKEYDTKYGRVENVLKAGIGVDNLEEATNKLSEFYQEQGIEIPTYSLDERDYERLGYDDAEDIISGGLEEVMEETDRLSQKDISKMSTREKAMYKRLAEYGKAEMDKKELAKIGVSLETLEDPDYKEFASKLDPNMSSKDKYEFYLSVKPKEEIKVIGSLENKASEDGGIKDFYTRDEALKFTKQDFDKNPKLYEAVQNSMLKW